MYDPIHIFDITNRLYGRLQFQPKFLKLLTCGCGYGCPVLSCTVLVVPGIQYARPCPHLKMTKDTPTSIHLRKASILIGRMQFKKLLQPMKSIPTIPA